MDSTELQTPSVQTMLNKSRILPTGQKANGVTIYLSGHHASTADNKLSLNLSRRRLKTAHTGAATLKARALMAKSTMFRILASVCSEALFKFHPRLLAGGSIFWPKRRCA